MLELMSAGLSGQAPAASPADMDKLVSRETPNVSPQRAALVAQWQEKVLKAKDFWKRPFAKMREDQKFAAGKQWPGQLGDDDRYVANIVLRHIAQRVAVVYGKNPKVIARRKERLTSSVWDGSFQQLQGAIETLMQNIPDPTALAIIEDVSRAKEEADMLDKVAKTLELLFQYMVDEQAQPFKPAMKDMVRRTLTTGVGYVRLGFQRAMKMRPEIEKEISDLSQRLALVQRLSEDIADGEIDPNAAEVEQLRMTMQSLKDEPMQIVREGLSFTFPDSTALIPDPRTTRLRGFVGSRWVAEEFLLTAEDIQEIYGKDVASASSAMSYRRLDNHGGILPEMFVRDNKPSEQANLYCVWEIFSKADGLVYVVCEGYPEFLAEPASPDVWMERFYPWFVFCTNEVYYPECIFPPSDVSLIRDMQLELNRARQGLREQRRANRPKMAVAAGVLDDEDKSKLRTHPANALVELQALQPGQRIDDLLQAVKMPPIDPSLYDTNPAYEDILRVVGVQEANLGGTAGSTATESSIAESSRMSALSSTVDDLDEMLTELARTAGQVLMLNVDAATVAEIVGPGAVWPTLNREQVAKEIYLEVEAASTGRPNKAAEVQNMTQLAPLIMQIPGINPEWLGREMIRRMDDRLDLKDAFMAGVPSIQSMNRQTQTTQAVGDPNRDPNAQGGQGTQNAQDTAPTQNNVAPRPSNQPPPMSQMAQMPQTSGTA